MVRNQPQQRPFDGTTGCTVGQPTRDMAYTIDEAGNFDVIINRDSENHDSFTVCIDGACQDVGTAGTAHYNLSEGLHDFTVQNTSTGDPAVPWQFVVKKGRQPTIFAKPDAKRTARVNESPLVLKIAPTVHLAHHDFQIGGDTTPNVVWELNGVVLLDPVPNTTRQLWLSNPVGFLKLNAPIWWMLEFKTDTWTLQLKHVDPDQKRQNIVATYLTFANNDASHLPPGGLQLALVEELGTGEEFSHYPRHVKLSV